MKLAIIIVTGLLLATGPAWSDDKLVDIHAIDDTGTGSSLGTIAVSETPYGTLFSPALTGLTPGLHGFHVHENPTCSAAVKGGKTVPGLAAGGHYDPADTGRHEGPYANGHLGDLPPLFADTNGQSTLPVLSPRIKLSDLRGRSLMIHAGGDNFADSPMALGGGGARVACGVVR
jgi:Cu-Zn family superoxide dismutase